MGGGEGAGATGLVGSRERATRMALANTGCPAHPHRPDSAAAWPARAARARHHTRAAPAAGRGSRRDRVNHRAELQTARCGRAPPLPAPLQSSASLTAVRLPGFPAIARGRSGRLRRSLRRSALLRLGVCEARRGRRTRRGSGTVSKAKADGRRNNSRHSGRSRCSRQSAPRRRRPRTGRPPAPAAPAAQ